jgi:hypothetical protein
MERNAIHIINLYKTVDKMEEAGTMMVPYFKEMEMINNSSYILGNITLHEAMERVMTSYSPTRKFISLRSIINNQQEKLEGNKLMIIGSRYTMKNSYIPNILLSLVKNTQIVEPTDDLVEEIDKLRKSYYDKSDPSKAEKVFGKLTSTYPNVTFIISCTEHAIALSDVKDQRRFLNLPKEQCYELLRRFNEKKLT